MELRIGVLRRLSVLLLFGWVLSLAAGCTGEAPRVVVITATFSPLSQPQASVSTPAATVSTSAPIFTAGNPTPDAPRGVLPNAAQQHIVQAGDTLTGIAFAYGVSVDTLITANALVNPDILEVGQALQLPGLPTEQSADFKILPDSRLIRSMGADRFDTATFIQQQPGYIRTATDEVGTNQANGEPLEETLSAAQIVERVSLEYSVDARVLLALLEYRAGWLSNPNPEPALRTHPMISLDNSGAVDRAGLYRQLAWTANNLNAGYYGWKTRGWTTLEFETGERILYANGLNAGSVALQYFLSRNWAYSAWQTQVAVEGFYQTYYAYFGDPFAEAVDPVIPLPLEQPELGFPFVAGETWFFTGGAHGGWGSGSAWAAVDFAPPDVPQAGTACYTSAFWVTAVAPGLIVRSGGGAVVLDLDGDGNEATGWTILYLHIATEGRVPVGTLVQPGDRIGHASCEGGFSTATHLHLARRYNGEWVPAYCESCGAGDTRPQMVLNGWGIVGYPNQEYQGYMERSGERRIAEQGRNTPDNRVSW